MVEFLHLVFILNSLMPNMLHNNIGKNIQFEKETYGKVIEDVFRRRYIGMAMRNTSDINTAR